MAALEPTEMLTKLSLESYMIIVTITWLTSDRHRRLWLSNLSYCLLFWWIHLEFPEYKTCWCYVILWRPLVRIPSILPVMIFFSGPSFRIIWPKIAVVSFLSLSTNMFSDFPVFIRICLSLFLSMKNQVVFYISTSQRLHQYIFHTLCPESSFIIHKP